MQQFLTTPLNEMSILNAYEWEREARKQEWYPMIHNLWIDHFRDILEERFKKYVMKIEKTPHLSYLKSPGWDTFDFLKIYKFPESKVNFSESWFQKNYPAFYQDIFNIEDKSIMIPHIVSGDGLLTDISEVTLNSQFFQTGIFHQNIHNDRFKLDQIRRIYQNPSTTEQRKTELLERYPSLLNLLEKHEGGESFNHPLDIKTLPTLNSFLDFFFESYQIAVETNDFSSIMKIFKIKKYINYIERIKEYNPYSMNHFDPLLNEKIERYRFLYIQLFYEKDSLDTVMHCITSKHITIEMIEEHFDDIIKYYIKSRQRIFDNPHVNVEIYRRWTQRIQTMEKSSFSGEFHITTPMNLSFEIYDEYSLIYSSLSEEFLTLDIERVHWMNRQYQIYFVQSYFPESLLKHTLIEYL